MYPFTLGIHEYDVEDDAVDSINGPSSGDVYFPSFFRNVICDRKFLDNVSGYLNMMLSIEKNFEDLRTELMALIKILGRVCLPSGYSFKNEEEKEITRTFSLNWIEALSMNCKYMNFYYLDVLLDIFSKIMSMYDTFYSKAKK